jgi:hypothetical protein
MLTRLLGIITAALVGLPSSINHGAQSRVAAPLSFQRVEIIAQPAVARQLLARLEKDFFPRYAMIASESDVRVLRRDKF